MTSQAASRPPLATQPSVRPPARPTWRARILSADTVALLVVIAVAALTWLPRWRGPIDLRWDGSVHYILGTALAQGKGYRLLNEPGEIAAVQYPPLLPAIVAAHQLALGNSDPWIVGSSLRVTAFLAFIAFAVVALRFLRMYSVDRSRPARRSRGHPLHEQLVSLRRALPRNGFRGRHDAVPDVCPAQGVRDPPGARLCLGGRLVHPEDGGDRGPRRPGARQPPSTKVAAGTRPCCPGNRSGPGLAGVCRIRRTQRGVTQPGVCISTCRLSLLQRQLSAQHRAPRPLHARQGAGAVAAPYRT